MLSKAAFVDFILNGGDKETAAAPQAATDAALPDGFEGFEGFDTVEIEIPSPQPGSTFARRLLEASGFGNAAYRQRSNVIRSSDAVARYLPERLSYWPKTPARPYQTLLFEADLNHKGLLAIPAFKTRKISHLDMVEDALARLVSEALEGFQRGGEGVTADVLKGRKEETLCVVSILDEREGQPVRLVCFGTQNEKTGGLETFQITEQTRLWDGQLAREHLHLLYERQFKKLESQDWQEAFTTTEERRQADKLLEVCTRATPKEHDIQESILDLLDTIAKGFGLKKPAKRRRLQAFALPSDHDIGINSEDREKSFGGHNPFGGVTLRDEHNRLLGYIVYPLKAKGDAVRLRKHLTENNRFHNVLVVYPDEDQASIELWQGREQLTGKLRKGQGYKDAADVVNLLSRFFVVSKAKVRNPTELAQELAYRARYLRRLAVKQLNEEQDKGPLRDLYSAFKEALLHDLSEDKFADAYAQTITYGLLTARWTGNAQLIAEGERLTRQTALKHMPASSPFLKEFFKAVLAVRLDEQQGRLLWLVDDIADLLDRVDVEHVFGAGDPESTITKDPVIHFYEPFLNAYDPKLKKELGVFYTPRPIVSYIVRSVHELLQTEFGLADGLAATTTWGEMLKKHSRLKLPPLTDDPSDKRTISPDEPFVQILDPATGTATFLVEVIEVIFQHLKAKWAEGGLTTMPVLPGVKTDRCEQFTDYWNLYVPSSILPRIHAFELMMAPYVIAHMKIGLKLVETGYRFGTEERARIYLTNALEPKVKQLAQIGFDALAHEAAAVNEIKWYKRFTVVIGNPPYSGISSNMSEYAQHIVDAYKIVDGGALNEKKLWLQDDYVKFIRKAQTTIDTARVGVFGYITSHSYLDNPTFRGMRQSLMGTFHCFRVLDLHGNTTRSEHPPDGVADKNVFDIQQGVAICLASRGGSECGVEHADSWGSREAKYSWLAKHSVANSGFSELTPDSPYYFFKPQNTDCRAEYDSGWKINDAMPINCAGFITARDHFVVDIDKKALLERVADFANLKKSDAAIRETYFAGCGSRKYPDGDTRGWKVPEARRRVAGDKKWKDRVRICSYRPFDQRPVYWADWMVDWPRPEVSGHMLAGTNVAFHVCRQSVSKAWAHILVASGLIDDCYVSNKSRERGYTHPLYLYESDGGLAFGNHGEPNFAPAFLRQLAIALNLTQAKPHNLPCGLTPEDIFRYTYAVFHSPGYRSRYAEFLKIDFPRLPLPGNLELFRGLARLGSKLTALHLLESPRLDQPITKFIGSPNPQIENPTWTNDTVWVDKHLTAGFKGVPEDVWNFHIGGYQVCHKWLKDRKGRTLSDDDVVHYHKIVVALSETILLMREIDEVIDKHGGWPDAFVTKKAGDNA